MYNGGPIDTGRGFVLHQGEQSYTETLNLDQLKLTTSKDILDAIADDQHAPDKSLIALGFSGWQAGQLESEIAENSWLTCAADTQILFDTPVNEKRSAAAAKLGVNLALLSSQAGRA